MRRFAFALLLVLVLAAALWHRELFHSRKTVTEYIDPTPPDDRVTAARASTDVKIKQRVTAAGLTYPPRQLFLRGFKEQRELEVWAGEDSVLKKVAVFPVLAASGLPGPKRREGDKQVPEGCYRVVVFNPKSNFHLSLGLDYPNASDRVLSDPKKPGFDIYIHGGAASVGCLALGDDAIEEVFLLASDVRARSQAEIPVHVFPARMEGSEWEAMQAEYPQHADFWARLAPIYAAFEKTKRVPAVRVESDGRYVLAN